MTALKHLSLVRWFWRMGRAYLVEWVRQRWRKRTCDWLISAFPDLEDPIYLAHAGGKAHTMFQTLFDNLGVQFQGRSFIDLGPGRGDSLDIARENGAVAEFVDYDPYVVALNTLKGFKGYMLDYTVKGLTRLRPRKYDFILSKGSINADRFNRKDPSLIPFPRWVRQVEDLASSDGRIVLCPTYDKGDGSYACKDKDAFLQSMFTRTLLGNGYRIMFVEGFNDERGFPFTFYKRLNER